MTTIDQVHAAWTAAGGDAAELDRYLDELRAAAWTEGEQDGQWNAEHVHMIARGLRHPLSNPYLPNPAQTPPDEPACGAVQV